MELHGHLPHLTSFVRNPIVYLTVVTLGRRKVLANADAFHVLTELWQHSAQIDGWFVGDYLLMPDHAHLFAKPTIEACSLAEWVKSWKSQSARRLRELAVNGRLWQEDYFDRFIRSQKDYSEKWAYIQQNPVKAGLCVSADQWPWKGRVFDLYFQH